jgi:uncharacterized small protein (DUF1192 family)
MMRPWICVAGGSLAEWHIAFRGRVKRGLRPATGDQKSALRAGQSRCKFAEACSEPIVPCEPGERLRSENSRASTIDGGDMAIEDDDRPRKKVSHEIGQDLSLLSVEELTERVALLSFEIERLQAAAAKKRASKDAANSIFK